MPAPKSEHAASGRKLAFWALGALLLMVLLVGSYSLYLQSSMSQRAEQENLAANKSQAEMGALFVEDHQKRLLERITAIASRNVFKRAFKQENEEDLRSFLLPLLSSGGEVQSVFLADPQRVCILGLPHGAAVKTLCAAPQEARPWVSPLHDDPFRPGRRVVTLSAPILDHDGSLLGYLGLHQSIAQWQVFLKRLTARPGRTYHLLDQEGQVVADGPGDLGERESDLLSLAQAVRHLMRERRKPLAWLAPLPGGDFKAFAAAAPLKDLGWVMVVLQAYGPAMASSQAMYRNSLFFLTLLMSCLFVLGAVLVSRYRIQQKLVTNLNQEARHLEVLVNERTADLQESTERYRRLLEDLPDVVYEVDQDSRITFVSRAMQNVLGYRPSEVHGRLWRDLVAPQDHAKFDQERTLAAQGQDMSIMALRHLAKNGEVRWLSIHSRVIENPRGRPSGRRGVARDVTAEVRAEKRVRELSGRLINAQEDERKRVALDLHDEMGQLLSALKIGLQSLARKIEGEEGVELTKLIQLSQKVMDRMRALAYRLRPSILDNFGLAAAVEDLCESLSESGMIQVDHELDEVAKGRLSPEASISLFRFVQEALTNAVKHSGSKRVKVRLEVGAKSLKVTVRDFGKGFDHAKVMLMSRNLGLLGMQERMALIGGKLSVNASERGAALCAEAPLEDENA